jgi:hypothetical protein
MTSRAGQVLRDRSAWQVTQIPRRPHGHGESAGGRDRGPGSRGEADTVAAASAIRSW